MITLETQRILWKDGATLRDLSVELNNYRGQNVLFNYEVGDYLYIGTFLPFNHRHFELAVPNAVQFATTVEYWNGDGWQAAVDIVDFSESFTKSGIIRFVPDDQKQNWASEQYSYDLPELAGTSIYDKFWLRISFDQTLTATTELKHVGFKFSDDDMLYGRYPDLNNQRFRNNFEPTEPLNTKLDWTEQHFIAAEAIVRDMKRKQIIVSQDQILDFSLLSEASIHKVAEIIYAALGEAYEANRLKVREYYNIALNQGKQPVDGNMNARLDSGERFNMSGRMSR